MSSEISCFKLTTAIIEMFTKEVKNTLHLFVKCSCQQKFRENFAEETEARDSTKPEENQEVSSNIFITRILPNTLHPNTDCWQVALINHYVENSRQLQIKGSACFDISVFAIRSAWKNAGMKSTILKVATIVEINKHRHETRIYPNDFWQNESLKFVKLMMFSDEAMLHLDRGVNVHSALIG